METKELRDHMNDKIVDKISATESKKEPQITREQRRYKERIEKEAKGQLERLSENFYEFFMDNDPASEEVANKKKELNAKWKMYCKARNLLPSALDAFERQIAVLEEKYKAEL